MKTFCCVLLFLFGGGSGGSDHATERCSASHLHHYPSHIDTRFYVDRIVHKVHPAHDAYVCDKWEPA